MESDQSAVARSRGPHTRIPPREARSDKHRLVYLVDGDDLIILQARFHYE